jgi:hypothetical protein
MRDFLPKGCFTEAGNAHPCVLMQASPIMTYDFGTMDNPGRVADNLLVAKAKHG